MEKIKIKKGDKIKHKVFSAWLWEKQDEIVDWINKHEKIMMKDRDWLLAKLGEIEDKKSDATEK